MLKYECNPDGTAKQGAALKMVHEKVLRPPTPDARRGD